VRLSSLLAAAVVLGGLAIPAPGADLGAPSASITPPPLWSGPYLGLHGGYGSARASGTSFDGILGGAHVGYNATVAKNLILGAEVDVSGADISRTDAATLFGLAASATTRTFVLGTARARLGYTVDRFMIYGTGGFVWAVNEIKGTVAGVTGTDTKAHAGYTFGMGLEWMVAPAWTARAEYLYAHFGSRGYFGGAAPSGPADANIVRFGVNYLFNH
jgi:outer membrane immunogenic protein